jgi:hypothetical protein
MFDQNIIEPKNIPMWTATGLIVALLALTLAVTNLYRSSAAAVINQAQVLLLSQKIDALTKQNEKTSTTMPKSSKP